MLWCESSKDCILLGLIDSDTYLHEFGKWVQNKREGVFITRLMAPHYTPPFARHYRGAVSRWCQSSPVIWQSGEAALSVSTSCGNDTADLPLVTNEARRGWREPSEGDSPSPWGLEVAHRSSVADLEYRDLPPEGACQAIRPRPRGTEVCFRVPGNVSLEKSKATTRQFECVSQGVCVL